MQGHREKFRRAALGAFVLCLAVSGCTPTPPPEVLPTADPQTRVTTAAGTWTGFLDGQSGARVWRGIRYAAPPTGALRWRSPQPIAPMSEAVEALGFGNPCPQIASPFGGAPYALAGELWGSEDCLFLNVYAPSSAREDARLPVMFWIHGGGNTAGHAGFYNGAHLAERGNVIVVTINYRLGILGWFRHPAFAGDSLEDASGNYATLDIIASLRWVRDNIAAFGGNPDQVIVFGESAGGTNVATLIASPLADGLFVGGIMQSGGVASTPAAHATHFADDESDPGYASSSNEVLRRAIMAGTPDCDHDCARRTAMEMPPGDAANLLRALDVAELFDLTSVGQPTALGPALPTVIADGHVLPVTPLIESFGNPARGNVVPMILGTNRDENKMFMAFDPDLVTQIAGLPIRRKDADLYEARAEFGALAWKLRGVDEPARALADAGVPVWTYRWDWDEQGSYGFVDLSQLLGAAHGLEIPFVFGHFDVGPQSGLLFDEENAAGRIALSEQMMDYWAEFAWNLDPGRGRSGAAVRWESFQPGGVSFLRLDAPTTGSGMETQTTTLDALVESLLGDSRLESAAERCGVFQASFSHDTHPSIADAAERLGCAVPL